MNNLSMFAAPLFVGLVRDQTVAFSLGIGIVALSEFGLTIAGYLIPRRETDAPCRLPTKQRRSRGKRS